MKLEQIVAQEYQYRYQPTFLDKLAQPIQFLGEHPVAIGTLFGLGSLGAFESLGMVEPTLGYAAPVGVLAYLLNRALYVDYSKHHLDITRTHGKSLSEKVLNWGLDNDAVASLLAAAGVAGLWSQQITPEQLGSESNYAASLLRVVGLTGLTTELGTHLLRSARRLSSSGTSFLDRLFEQPLFFASIVGATSAIRSYTAFFTQEHAFSALEVLPAVAVYALRDSLQTIRTRLETLNPSDRDQVSLLYGLAVLPRHLDGIIRVYDKDAHPDNWFFPDTGGVCVLDCERRRVVPLTMDLANLYGYTGFPSFPEKLDAFEQYCDQFNQWTENQRIKDRTHYQLALLSSLILRAYELAPLLVNRGERRDVYESFLATAQEAIAMTSRKFPWVYDAAREQYHILDAGLRSDQWSDRVE